MAVKDGLGDETQTSRARAARGGSARQKKSQEPGSELLEDALKEGDVGEVHTISGLLKQCGVLGGRKLMDGLVGVELTQLGT